MVKSHPTLISAPPLTLQLQIATAYVDTLGGAASGFNLAQNRIHFGFAFTWAQKFTNSAGNKIRMRAYEGGYSPDILGAAGADVNALRFASKFVVDVGKAIGGGTFDSGEVVAGNYADFLAAGEIGPSCFDLGGGSGSSVGGNIWAVLDPNVYLTPQPAQLTAIAAFNR